MKIHKNFNESTTIFATKFVRAIVDDADAYNGSTMNPILRSCFIIFLLYGSSFSPYSLPLGRVAAEMSLEMVEPTCEEVLDSDHLLLRFWYKLAQLIVRAFSTSISEGTLPFYLSCFVQSSIPYFFE